MAAAAAGWTGEVPAELYACGAGVHVPTLRVTDERKRGGSSAAAGLGEPQRRRRSRTDGQRTSLRGHVRELRRCLTFSGDVVSSRSPHAISYSQAREQLPCSFLLPPLASSRKKPDRREGLCDHRRHLCYLHGPPAQGRLTPTPSHPSSSLQPQPSHVVSHAPSCPSGMLYRKLKTVPASMSCQWEGRVLAEVTSFTAARLGGAKKKKNKDECDDVESVKCDEVKTVEEKQEHDDYKSCLGKGARPIWKRGRGDTLILNNNTTFNKVLQRSYPQPHTEWCGEQDEQENEQLVKGERRWLALPQPAPMPEALQWSSGDSESQGGHLAKLKHTPPSHGQALSSHQHIMREWSKQRSIHIQPQDSAPATILRGLCSITDSARMRAMVACSSLPQPDIEVVKELQRIVVETGSTAVQVLAAIALHCLGRAGDSSVQALVQAVKKRMCDDVDEWAGLQCLVEAGVCEECVVEGLQRFLINSSHSSTRQRAGEMMARLSDRMPLVHALLAEQLTSRGWQERLSACLVLPSLLCPLSADVCNRLVVMSWEDWSSSVRDAASQALGKTGQGKLLHDELVRRLGEGTEMERLEALKKIHNLQLMTPQLLSAFLPSLSDQHASIRVEAIAICGQLCLRDEGVLQELIQLLGDPIWTIRAHTLRALRSIGCRDSDVIEQLLWSVRCDKVAAVRAEACYTLSHLCQSGCEEEENLKPRVISALRDRLVVEDSQVVTTQLEGALGELGGSVEREDNLASSVTSEVRRLGTCDTIIQGIVEGDREALTTYVFKRPLAHLTTRDYLSPQQRNKFYSDKKVESGEKRVWSPDKRTIERHLEAIQKLCLSSNTHN